MSAILEIATGRYPDRYHREVFCRVCLETGVNARREAMADSAEPPGPTRDAEQEFYEYMVSHIDPSAICIKCGGFCCFACYHETDRSKPDGRPLCLTCEDENALHTKEMALLFDTLRLDAALYPSCKPSTAIVIDQDGTAVCERCDRTRYDCFACGTCSLVGCLVCSEDGKRCSFCTRGDLRPSHKAAIVQVAVPNPTAKARELKLARVGRRARIWETSLRAYNTSLVRPVFKEEECKQ